MVASIIAIALSDLGMNLLGKAAMAAIVGGVGMDAMLGTTLAQCRQPQLVIAEDDGVTTRAPSSGGVIP